MFKKIVLVIGAIVAGYISVRALIAPEAVLSNFGLIVDGADGRNEVRGQYGGFFLAVAVALLLGLLGYLSERFALGVLLITVGGVLFGRLASIVIEGPAILSSYSPAIKLFIGVDIVLVILAILAIRQR